MKNKLIALAKKENIELEIYERACEKTEIYTLNQTLKQFQVTDVSSFIIKAILNGKAIKFAIDTLNNPEKIIHNIKTIYALQENENQNCLCKENISHKLEKIEQLDYSKVKNDILNLDELKKQFPEIISIEGLYTHYQNGYFIDNENCKLEDETYFNEYGINITVEKNNVKKVAFYSYYSKEYNMQGFIDYITSKIQYLLIKLNEVSIKTDKYKVVLKNNVVTSILSTFSDSFQSKEIAHNTSIFSSKLNKKIFNEKINIIEDSQNGIEPRYFDSEGTPTKRKEIVKNGVFQTELNDLEYALKNNVSPTGNSNGVNNLFIEPGALTFEELIQKLENGIIIDEVYGLHSGIDKKSGNISVQAEGILVKNGKLETGLETCALTTNLFEIFSNVLEVGNDLSTVDIEISAPSLLLEHITVTGKK